MTISIIKNTNGILEQVLIDDEQVEDQVEDEEEEQNFDMYEALEQEQEKLPSTAWDVASYEGDTDHSPGLTWRAELTLYVAPIREVDGGFALLVLDWDDNWGQWEWRCEAAVKGAASRAEATKALLTVYRDDYLEGSEGAFREFLQGLV